MGLFLPVRWTSFPSAAARRLAVLVVLLLSAGALSGCKTVGYYSQAAGGQLKLLYQRQDVDELLEELRSRQRSESDQALMAQLELSQQILAFAESQLGLDVGRRYRSYVELDESNVVWNLFAAPQLSLTPKTWCYPFVGCAPYRGYFDREDALDYQSQLETEGYETYLGGVAAYSTLGWFDDPLLSSFVHWPEVNLADLLFHELAHSRVWVKGDVGFNEAFASFVGREGLRQWLQYRGDESSYQTFVAAAAARQQFLALLTASRQALEAVYASDRPDAQKLHEKAAVITSMRDCFAADPEAYGGERYERIVASLNNALLVSVATYDDQVPAFAALFAEVGGDWAEFYDAVAALGELDEAQRSERMRALGESQIADHADDDGTEQIQCQALSGHGFDVNPAGTEDNYVRRGSNG